MARESCRRRRAKVKRLPPRGKLSPQATDEGRACGGSPYTGKRRKLAPHPASGGASATFPRGGSLRDAKKRTLSRPLSVSKNLPLRGRCPEGAEGENLAIARNISDSRTVLSPTACGRSPLAEGAKG